MAPVLAFIVMLIILFIILYFLLEEDETIVITKNCEKSVIEKVGKADILITYYSNGISIPLKLEYKSKEERNKAFKEFK